VAVYFSRPLNACLTHLRQAFTFTPAATGLPQSVAGILIEGSELEEHAPGDGSTYAALTVSSAIVPIPAAGDEIASATTTYQVLKPERDLGGGLRLLLRKHEDIIT
jgi:hypothetical protein